MNSLVKKQMNYTLTYSLKHTTLVKISTILWNQDDIMALVETFNSPLLRFERPEKWQEIEDKVIEKVPQLPLPGPLKEEILGFIKPMGIQILIWMKFHRNLLRGSCVKNNLTRLCWTPQGIVDRKKTAVVLIKNENLDIAMRYQLACIYCLEEDVTELWNSMPERTKAALYNGEYPTVSDDNALMPVVFWTLDMQGEVDKINDLIKVSKGIEISRYQFAFDYAVNSGNKAATEYYFFKLTPSEREESIVRSAEYATSRCCYNINSRLDLPKEYYADVLCFLLSQMNEDEQVKVFEKKLFEVLKCFLDWPWQSFFILAANHVCNLLSKECYSLLLTMIVYKVRDGYKDYGYQTLLGELWLKSSMDQKEYVIIDEYASFFLLMNLFKVNDTKNISLILKDATLAQKERCVFSLNICESLVYSYKWDLLKFFLNECIPSQEKVIKLKEEFKNRISCLFPEEQSEEENDMWNTLFRLLDDLIQENDDTRDVEEGNCSPSKRFCNAITEPLQGDP